MPIKKINLNIFMGMFLSIFLISFYIRQPILKEISSPNIIFLFLLIILFMINIRHVDMKKFIYVTIIFGYIFIQDYIINGNSIQTIICNIAMYIIPLYIFSLDYDVIDIKETLRVFTIIISIFTIVIFIIGLIDPVINFAIMRFMGEHIVTGLQSNIIANTSIALYRYTSFLGHSLFTKEIFLYFYLLNDVYERSFGEQILNKSLVTILALVGVLLTGSKTGTILMIVLLLISQINNIKRTVTMLIILLITFECGFFDVVINRFDKGDLTTGRDVAWEKVVNSGFEIDRLMYGYGELVSDKLGQVIEEKYVTAALEYPVIILSLKYGMICTGLILFLIYLYPIMYFLRKKKFYILIIFIAKLIDINTYNGLIYKADNMILFSIFTYLLMGVCSYGEQKE